MTELLQRAIREIEKLSDEQQDAIATRLLAEVKDELAWQECFKATTDRQWDNMVALVRQGVATGEVTPLDTVFPLER